MKTVTFNGLTFEPYITYSTISKRVEELGREIAADYAGRQPLFICVLNGAFPFAADLFRAVEGLDSEITFIRLKSYSGTETTGKVRQITGLQEDIEGRDVIIVEDIVDTGFTIKQLISDLRERRPSSIRVASLLFKPESVRCDLVPDYVGFSIPPKFIIGYGLDIDEKARNLRDIYVLKEDNKSQSTNKC